VSSRLTLNPALCYDLFPPYYEKNNAFVGFDCAKPGSRVGNSLAKLERMGYTFRSTVDRLMSFGVKSPKCGRP